MNLRADHTFAEDEGWHLASERYAEFLRRHQNVKVVYKTAETHYAALRAGEKFKKYRQGRKRKLSGHRQVNPCSRKENEKKILERGGI